MHVPTSGLDVFLWRSGQIITCSSLKTWNAVNDYQDLGVRRKIPRKPVGLQQISSLPLLYFDDFYPGGGLEQDV